MHSIRKGLSAPQKLTNKARKELTKKEKAACDHSHPKRKRGAKDKSAELEDLADDFGSVVI